jgi:uncharacterized protein (DUF58 family)
MIAPSSRLLWWTALVLVPAAALAGVFPGAALLWGLVLLGFVAVTVVDAVASKKPFRNLRVFLPEVVRLTKDRPGAIEVRFENSGLRSIRIRVGLPLPREITSSQADVFLTLPAETLNSQIALECVPQRRGRFTIDRCFVEVPSPLRFWGRRGIFPVRSELRVYPDLSAERRKVAALFLHQGAFGVHRFRQVGKGRDFEKLREYISGDSAEDIHWKATAKRGRPVTKVFQIERTQEVYVIVDGSRLSARRTGGTLLLERYVNSALLLCLAAAQQSDLFGLLAFTDRVRRFVRAKNGKTHYDTCRDALYTLQPETVTPDFEDLFTFVRTRLRRRALLIFLTSLDDPVLSEGFVENINLLSRQHLVVVNMMQPAPARALFTGTAPANVDEIYGRFSGHLLWHDLNELGKKLQRQGVQFSLLQDETMAATLVSQYLRIKQRQLL